MSLKLKLQEIEDLYSRENFARTQNFVNEQTFMKGLWEFFELQIPAAVTNYKFKHNLSYQPKDVIVTSTIGTGSIVFNYALFDKLNLDITTTGPVTVRFFLGRYENKSDK